MGRVRKEVEEKWMEQRCGSSEQIGAMLESKDKRIEKMEEKEGKGVGGWKWNRNAVESY